MILLIDNYDSFTYNLYQMIGELYEDILVKRNDEITIEEIKKLSPKAIIISPGPGFPADAGISVEAVREFSGKVPILGICLGHQAIAEAFGGKIIHAKAPVHGKASEVKINTSCPLFYDLASEITVARYHSLVADSVTLPSCLSAIGTDELGQIMALKHKTHPTYGLQFHPESILTETGSKMLSNFLSEIAGIRAVSVSAPAVPQEKRVDLKKYISKVIDGINLTESEAYAAMDCIMSDRATNAQIASFITALRMKGETVDEITGFAKLMRQKAKSVALSSDAIDIVGTGGDLANSFNISTTSAFVIAGAGLNVAKHGNRSVSSRSGAADVLEALGVRIALSPSQAEQCLENCGVCFLFAQAFHGSMKYAAAPRREIGVRSVFNILGPLANPASAQYILLGVYDEKLMEPMAQVLINLGIKGAMLVHGDDGLDEISVSSSTSVCEIRDGKIIKYKINPEDFGMPLAKKSEIVGGSALDNAKITLGVLSGKAQRAQRDIVLLNAGCALYIAKKAESISEGIKMARESIEGGAALKALEKLKNFTNSVR
ncbi:MAG: bifunctional anthranilate synthase component II/anthranilate phosphoribosyltransferase [Oscillospiraceae bacterium]|nr:bifunctional anthranilate synthase component II/anthranilate phosphoribosyltransferase [Oscillospiraceae bacterium]